MSGGGGSAPAEPTERTVTNTRITGEAMPYYKRLMRDAESVTGRDYQAYGGQRIAGQAPDTLAAYDLTRGIVGSGIGGLPEAMDVSRSNIAAGQTMAAGATPYTFDSGTYAAAPTTAGQFGETQMFTPQAAEQYMSPFIQNVLNRQTAEARRQFDIGQGARDAQAVQSGAFGGSRSAVAQSLAEQDLARQMGDIYGTGLQSAYQDAQQAFQADRGAGFERERAQMAERARAQELGAGEAGRVQAGRADLAGQQAAENARARQEQLQMLGFSSDEAMRLAGLGEQERAAQIQDAQMLEAIGKVQEGREQRGLDIGYQDFIRQEAYPEQQLQIMSSILQGVPIETATTQMAYAPNDPMREAMGMGLQAIGAYKGLSG